MVRTSLYSFDRWRKSAIFIWNWWIDCLNNQRIDSNNFIQMLGASNHLPSYNPDDILAILQFDMNY